MIICIVVQTLQNFSGKLDDRTFPSVAGYLVIPCSHPPDPRLKLSDPARYLMFEEKQIFDCFNLLIHPPWCQVKEVDHLHPDCVFICCVVISNEAKYMYKINITNQLYRTCYFLKAWNWFFFPDSIAIWHGITIMQYSVSVSYHCSVTIVLQTF